QLYLTGDLSRLLQKSAAACCFIATHSLHDALPIYNRFLELDSREHLLGTLQLIPEDLSIILRRRVDSLSARQHNHPLPILVRYRDRKSTRLNSSHVKISYAVFCLKKKKTKTRHFMD